MSIPTHRLLWAAVLVRALTCCADSHAADHGILLSAEAPPPTDLSGEFRAESPILSSVPSTFTGVNLNTLLGADAFYSQGLTGSNATVANVESGHVWNGHDTLGHVTTFVNSTSAFDDPNTPGAQQTDLVDRHGTWVGAVLAGRLGGAAQGEFQRGIAYGATLESGAIATSWSGTAYSGAFGFNTSSFFTPYEAFFGSADVINSSWGGVDATGTGFFVRLGDALANENPSTTWVVSAGNSGPTTNTVAYPGSGYNAITVGALTNGGDNSYDEVASFSSRGPQDWSGGGLGCSDCRAAVDLVAPGSSLTAAFYGGTTGGNNTTLAGSTDSPGTAIYSGGVAGTSFSSPIVAGAATLVADASYADPELSSNGASRDARVVKAVLMNSAAKIPGWDNAQAPAADGALETSQSLDPASGAGALDIGAAYGQYVEASTRDVPGTAAGDQGSVGAVGWDFGLAFDGGANTYSLAPAIPAGAEVTATLTWFRERSEDFASSGTATDVGQADLDLIIREVESGDVVARSISAVNVSEHLHFLAPVTGRYVIEVDYFGDVFGSLGSEFYGLAWAVEVPEPTGPGLLGAALVGLPSLRRGGRNRRRLV